MIYEYIYDDDGEQIQFESTWNEKYPEYIAEDAAQHLYDSESCEDFELLFPAKLEIFKDGESLGKFEVALEYEPSFSAVEI